jgi:aspartyl-tRNA(Asn)/glutamyl-tRNA(Gln) amidotransferase subunit B
LPGDPAWRGEILPRLPELPLERRARFVEQYRLLAYDATILTEERSLSDYFETAVRLRGAEGDPKALANWVQNEILRRLNEQGLTAAQLPFTPAHLAELVQLVESKTITRQTGVGLIAKVIETGQTPRAIVEAEGLGQISGDDAIRAIARQVIDENPGQVEAYRKKPTLLKWFVGQVMKKSQGKANAPLAEKVLLELLQ